MALQLQRQRRRRVLFVLTPLIDVIFLLLIFFMLSSQIAPYSLMPIGRISAGGEGPSDAPWAAPGAPPLTVRLAHGHVSIGGDSIAIEELAAAAERFRADGITAYILIPAATADVQDVVAALEALRNAGGEVTLLNAGSAR